MFNINSKSAIKFSYVLIMFLCIIMCSQRDIEISWGPSVLTDAMCGERIVVNIGPPMSDMSLLSVSMHLSFKHQPVINQTFYTVASNALTPSHCLKQY